MCAGISSATYRRTRWVSLSAAIFTSAACRMVPWRVEAAGPFALFAHSPLHEQVKELLGVAGLACVHTVDSLKLAQELQKRKAQLRPEQPLDVMVQVVAAHLQ